MDKANIENLRRMQKAVALMGECESRSLWWPANVANAREGLRAELSGVMLSCCKDSDFKDLYAYLGDFPETVAGNEQLFCIRLLPFNAGIRGLAKRLTRFWFLTVWKLILRSMPAFPGLSLP